MRGASIRRRGGQMAAVAVLALAATAAPAAAEGHGGKPTITHETFNDTMFDEFIFEVCGVSTTTTRTGRVTTLEFPDGTRVQHANVTFTPGDPSIAAEHDVANYVFAPDGTVTITGVPIRLYRHGEGTIVRDAGWLRILEDEVLIHGPHEYFFAEDPAPFYC